MIFPKFLNNIRSANCRSQMDDLSIAVIGGLVGVAGSFVLTYIRDIYLHKKRTREQHRQVIVESRLEKLYTPLYQLIKAAEFLTGKQALTFSYSSGVKPEESREKVLLDSTIENYLYLADDDLMMILPQIHGAGFYQEKGKDNAEQVVKLVVRGYEKLRKEYFAFGK